MPAEFHFLRPEWLWAVPAVIGITIMLARRHLAPGSWQAVVDPALVPYVLSTGQIQGLTYRWWLILIGGILAALALAGPSWNRVEQPVFRSEQAIVIALDLSRSMDAQDLTPSRLTRARLKILDILEERSSGQTALVVYSSNAFTVTPLTTDADTVAALVNSLSTDIMPSRGSYPLAAINKGRQLLEQAGVALGEVLLITDGGSSPAAEQAAEELNAAGYTLSVLAVGTADGAPIPRAGGGFVTDRAGNIAVPRLETGGLRRLAAAGGGRFAEMTADDLDQMAEDYLDIADEYLGDVGRSFAEGCLHVVSAIPGNVKNLGHIHRVFPQAPIIHVERNPLDNCLECFFKEFGSKHHSYSNNLEDLGFYYRQYQRIMSHWRDVLKIPMLEISYEELVTEPEATGEKLYRYIGLDMDERAFGNSGEELMFRSDGIGRWKNYEKELQPLIRSLS